MTEAGWTRNAPTKEGWYWWKYTGEPSVVKVVRSMYGLVIEGHVGLVSCMNANWLGPITPGSYQQGWVAANVDALVDRFLAWPLPASVCSDLCATKQGYPHRSGTNLLSAVEAKAMIEHVLGIAQQAQDEKGVGDA